MSQRMATASARSLTAAPSLFSLLPTMITLFPLALNNRAVARPIPDPPPVIRIVLFVMSIFLDFYDNQRHCSQSCRLPVILFLLKGQAFFTPFKIELSKIFGA